MRYGFWPSLFVGVMATGQYLLGRKPDLAAELSGHGVVFSAEPERSGIRDHFAWGLPAFLFGAMWLLLLRGSAPAREIECAVRGLRDAALARATSILERNRSALELGARRLLDKETLAEQELPAVVAEDPYPSPAGTPLRKAGMAVG